MDSTPSNKRAKKSVATTSSQSQLITPGVMEAFDRTGTTDRNAMLIMSESTTQAGLVELTVPTEERIEISAELKKAKYAPILEEGKQKGWRVRCNIV